MEDVSGSKYLSRMVRENRNTKALSKQIDGNGTRTNGDNILKIADEIYTHNCIDYNI